MRRDFSASFGLLPLALVLAGIGLCSWLENRSRPGAPPLSRWHQGPYDRELRAAAQRHLPPEWDWRVLKALAHQESRFRPDARSPVGARGICQIMPDTARDLGVSPDRLDDPRVNADAAARYLRRLWELWPHLPDGPPHWTRLRFTLACYNGGRGRVRRIAGETNASTWERLQPHLPQETQTYVHRIVVELYPAYASSGFPRPDFSPARP